MKVFRSFSEARGIRNPVVTTGSFDGVHIGHKTILKRLRALAEMHNGESVLITFDPHPRKVLYPDTAGKDLKLILSQKEKLELLSEAGLDNIIIIEFTKDFARTTSEEFVRDFLTGSLGARVIVVGFNHHFGFNKEGDYKQLWEWQKKYGFLAEEIPEQDVENETVSSTKIRKAISEGYIQRANAYLDHFYIVIGLPEKYSCEICSELPQFFNIDFRDDCKLLPSPGIYAVTAESDVYCSKAMAVIIKEPEKQPALLAHFFEELINDSDRNLRLSFHKRVQGSVNLQDPSNIARIHSAVKEISELIY
ncbi:MAG TPA: FAD synthetase family protein [Bacteroidales bacterium]|nr:FAD synthetase family protein [Bacteroidales bacterium]